MEQAPNAGLGLQECVLRTEEPAQAPVWLAQLEAWPHPYRKGDDREEHSNSPEVLAGTEGPF